ncbi:hypothetical protein MUK42_01081 [Musa troglodytarum]|uniref:Uncharacterized protein n=1 Tax=Musa troglodytarum TaxID=320322 RepID=A0A9E7FHB0_9LILI|nr:hypothetical protein MUK42_01081 [Musa troglodytarum]
MDQVNKEHQTQVAKDTHRIGMLRASSLCDLHKGELALWQGRSNHGGGGGSCNGLECPQLHLSAASGL